MFLSTVGGTYSAWIIECPFVSDGDTRGIAVLILCIMFSAYRITLLVLRLRFYVSCNIVSCNTCGRDTYTTHDTIVECS